MCRYSQPLPKSIFIERLFFQLSNEGVKGDFSRVKKMPDTCPNPGCGGKEPRGKEVERTTGRWLDQKKNPQNSFLSKSEWG